MQHEPFVVSTVISVLCFVVLLSVVPMSFQERTVALGEAMAGQTSRPIGTALMVKDALYMAGAHSCDAYLLNAALDAVNQGEIELALELDQRRLSCFPAP